MASPPPLSLRLGPAGLRALDEIARLRGFTRAEAARRAIAETAERDRRRAGLAAEAASLARDLAYVAEAREVAAPLAARVAEAPSAPPRAEPVLRPT